MARPQPCFPTSHGPEKTLCKRQGRTEIMFGRRRDWARFATRYDHRCPKAFLSAVAFAAIVIFWL
jgi:hypothetical protein